MVKQNKILVLSVEDNDVNRELITLYLDDFCKVDSTENGYEAVELAQEQTYDIFLIDINLKSSRDGVQTMEELKKLPKYKNTPFIAVTGYAAITDRDRFLALGFDEYLAKPFDKAELANLVKSFLKSEK